MKRFIFGGLAVLAMLLFVFWLRFGLSLQMPFQGGLSVWSKSEGKDILVDAGEGYEPFEIKGVNLGAGKPGYHATDYGITYDDYMRWFAWIQDMGANTIRVYTVLGTDFYRAFYDYNKNNASPLYLLHGLWLNDYSGFSHIQGYDPEFRDALIRDGHSLVDILHGKKLFSIGDQNGSGVYRWDISQWTLGYILGVEWEDVTVIYTDKANPERSHYEGRYCSTKPEASPFEALLAELSDEVIRYETERYGQQRLVALSNWPVTDPFDYSKEPCADIRKIAKVDVENIVFSPEFRSGTFASYHIYTHFPDYMNYYDDLSQFIDESGRVNTYRAYLQKINAHHTIPVVITEFGIPSSRGMARREPNQGRNQGHMSETQQAEALVSCYEDIKKAGCSGSIVFTWQDEWFKRTWNTLPMTDILKTPYWNDVQTNEQFFGILSFDPGKKQTACILDGKNTEWDDGDLVLENGGLRLYQKQDERYLYLMLEQLGLSEDSRLQIPFDITPKSGSYAAPEQHAEFERPADFLMILDGLEESRVLVQERYDNFKLQYQKILTGVDPFSHQPARDSNVFSPVLLALQTPSSLVKTTDPDAVLVDSYETGLLLHGNGDPESPDYNSLSDFCWGDNMVEIRLPWLLLNFSCPSEAQIHDDYYEHYGIQNLRIKKFYVGAAHADTGGKIAMTAIKLRPWYDRPTFHERLKPAYYAMQNIWKEN